MRILYGVQATGNGHITRARALAPLLAKGGAQVDYLFSGREPDRLFDMAVFGDYQCRKGLTFVTRAGRICYLPTLMQADFRQLMRDVKSLDLQQYDLVVTDFEPITAWAAKRAGKPSVAIGHQYAFARDVPKAANGLLASTILRYMAPARIELGVHWHHFDQAVLPPIIEPHAHNSPMANRVLVYLPFEDGLEVMSLLQQQQGYYFHFFSPELMPGVYANVQVHALSRDGFAEQLALAESVFCNAGFELASEALALGRKILVKPVRGQMEQVSNAVALQQLGYGWQMPTLDAAYLSRWLREAKAVQINYPDVAGYLAQWLCQGAHEPVAQMAQKLWSEDSVILKSTAAAGRAQKIEQKESVKIA